MANDDVLWKQVDKLRLETTTQEKATQARPSQKADRRTSSRSTGRLTGLLQDPSTAQSADRLSRLLASTHVLNWGTGKQLAGAIVGRPVAFYIPVSINERIDEAIGYMEKEHGVKVDRSALISAILGDPSLWEPASLDKLVDRTVSQLTNRLASRLTGRPAR